MATGRTVSKHVRIFMDGYSLACYATGIGPLANEWQTADVTTLCDSVKGYLPNNASIKVGVLNGIFDNTATSGLHVVANGAGVTRIVSVPIGIRAAFGIGDPVFNAHAIQNSYQASEEGGAVTANVEFGEWAGNATTMLYPWPWGVVLNANTARTGANAATGGPESLTGASTAFGGYMVYHVTASSNAAHTATISVDDSADDSTYLPLSGATTGVITVTAGVSGVVALGRTATVRRYTRWQLALGTATSVTFLLSFVRALG